MPDTRRHAPATARNRGPIADVLGRVLPERARVLEVASGTGEHAAAFATDHPGWTWQPTDPDPTGLASIAAWTEGLPNVRPAVRLDVREVPWPVVVADAVVCINMIHIAPWACAEALFHGATTYVPGARVLVLYGPYRIGGLHTAPSNEAFDADLRARDPAWGVRDLEAVVALGAQHGWVHAETVAMPANNQSVVFRRPR